MKYYDNLVIFDVSWVLHCGETITDPYYANSYYKKMITSGIKYFLHRMSSEYITGANLAFCFDNFKSKPTGYKSNRNFAMHVAKESDVLYRFLSRSKHCCLRTEGVEADSQIFSLVEKYKGVVSHIKIISNDRDIAHNVCNNVTQVAATINGIDIDKNNFINTVFPREVVPYNTISAFHTLVKDVSDTIKEMTFLHSPIRGRELYRKYVQWLEEHNDAYGFDGAYGRDPNTLKYFADFFLESEEDKQSLAKRIELMYPKLYQINTEPINAAETDSTHDFAIGNLIQLCNSPKLSKKMAIDMQSLLSEDIAFLNDFSSLTKNQLSSSAVDDIIGETTIVTSIDREGFMARLF